ncbi:hypothetical protein RDABS01_000052 [Bienertia sinuspersici]
MGDSIYWQDGKKGKFSIKVVMKLIRKEQVVQGDKSWDIIWTTLVLQRIKVFFGSHFMIESFAIRIGIRGKLLLHHHALNVGMTMKLLYTRSEIVQQLGAHGIVWGLATMSQPSMSIQSTLGYLLISIVPIMIMQRYGNHILIRFEEMCWALNLKHNQPLASSSRGREVLWHALNCDGAAKGSPGVAGGEGVIRDCTGMFVTTFSANFRRCIAFQDELRAIHFGIHLARELKIPRLVVQIENLACVQACKKLIQLADCEVKILHVYREANKAADLPANQVVAQADRIKTYNGAPVELRRIMELYIRGVAKPCFVHN